MNWYPILFRGPMVKAILEGRKTQTRRLVKIPRWGVGEIEPSVFGEAMICSKESGCLAPIPCPYGGPGDRLWVRETFSYSHGLDRLDFGAPRWFWADGRIPTHGDWTRPKPSIHMPRWASRISLEVTAVRVERVQDISEEDARAEGFDWASLWFPPGKAPERCDEDPREVGYSNGSFARGNFRASWDWHNAKNGLGWDANPRVWVIDFRRV